MKDGEGGNRLQEEIYTLVKTQGDSPTDISNAMPTAWKVMLKAWVKIEIAGRMAG